jgi:hypothetical protein
VTADRARAWVLWGVTRLIVVLLLRGAEHGAIFDVHYYAESLAGLGEHGLAGTMPEYPVPAVLVLAAPYALLHALGLGSLYVGSIVTLALALDAWFLALLLRTGRSTPVWAWIAATPALGVVSYARFDLLPGVLVAAALLALAGAPRRAGVLGVLAAGVKYSPALVLPALAAPAAGRARVIGAGAVAGILLVGASAAVGGWDRLVSPLRYQENRGLQIESISATPAMIRWAFSPDHYRVFYPSSKAWEIQGPGTDALLLASGVLSGLLLLGLLALWACAWRRLRDTDDGISVVVWLTLAAVIAFIVSGKVLSPQYLLWVLPVACAGLALVGERDRRGLARWTAVLLLVAALTHLIFPLGYAYLLTPSARSDVMIVVLVVRNLLLVGLGVTAFAATVRSLRAVRRRPTDPAVSRASA